MRYSYLTYPAKLCSSASAYNPNKYSLLFVFYFERDLFITLVLKLNHIKIRQNGGAFRLKFKGASINTFYCHRVTEYNQL